MKTIMKWVTVLGVLIPFTWLHGVSCKYEAADLQRLRWLCSDYQIPVQGYVIEAWFQVMHMPGVERFLEEQLDITSGVHQIELQDGSTLRTIMWRNQNKWMVELQLLAKTNVQAVQYYSQWQRFASRYVPEHPVGITVVAELPEVLDGNVSNQIAHELANGLELKECVATENEQYTQLSGFSEQLYQKIKINGTPVNTSITIVPESERTCIYIASPILYQQI